ncbi:MAG: SDR family oxidoreductase [Alphaproteobacteria bacterium]|nr:SDR family oxidoreductase [Alphaproteobacteria bacterium]MBT4017443.1 SDR family oxidoreductase [Alphaproteobacteria bacterium]MBT4966734.1 SDR family oxidoreductase [Alphaproteobacteria bacterium]MBT5158310.1 SDR family oxidoreductase [Alphaproteobacteria bacterium]MBT5918951.1 SDR family oxidoreductase [Alphaproteobacteria bacterium]
MSNSDEQLPTRANPLRGQHAFVTGASRGIGASIATELATLGANLSITGRDVDALNTVKANIENGCDVDVQTFVFDVTDAEAISRVMTEASQSFGPVSILVNNAGAATSAPFMKTDIKRWQSLLDINLTGPFLLTQAVLPAMLEAKSGRVINVASTAGMIGYSYVAPYVASKHGVIGLTRALATEYARSGVTFNSVCPGFTETDIAARTIDTMVTKAGRTEEEAYAELASLNPQGRLVQPDEVAQAVGWLALPSSSSINGQSIAVAGGEVM